MYQAANNNEATKPNYIIEMERYVQQCKKDCQEFQEKMKETSEILLRTEQKLKSHVRNLGHIDHKLENIEELSTDLVELMDEALSQYA